MCAICCVLIVPQSFVDRRRGRQCEALNVLQEAMQVLNEEPRIYALSTVPIGVWKAKVHLNMARCLVDEKQLDAAEKELKQAREAANEYFSLGDVRRGEMTLIDEVGTDLLRAQGELEAALKLAKEIVTQQEEKKHRMLGRSYQRVGDILMQMVCLDELIGWWMDE